MLVSPSACPIGRFSASQPYRSFLCQNVCYTCLCLHNLFQMSLPSCTNVPIACPILYKCVILHYENCAERYKPICATFSNQHIFFRWPYTALTLNIENGEYTETEEQTNTETRVTSRTPSDVLKKIQFRKRTHTVHGPPHQPQRSDNVYM
jgi:hypothetical protein